MKLYGFALVLSVLLWAGCGKDKDSSKFSIIGTWKETGVYNVMASRWDPYPDNVTYTFNSNGTFTSMIRGSAEYKGNYTCEVYGPGNKYHKLVLRPGQADSRYHIYEVISNSEMVSSLGREPGPLDDYITVQCKRIQ